MLLGVNCVDKVVPLKGLKQKNNDEKKALTESTHAYNSITGVPRSYIAFKQKDDKFNYTDDAKILIEDAKVIAKKYNHTQIFPQHIIKASIDATKNNIKLLGDDLLSSGAIENVSVLGNLANDYAKKNLLIAADDRKYLLSMIEDLNADNEEALNKIEIDKNFKGELDFSPKFLENLEHTATKSPFMNGYMVLGTAFNTITNDGIFYASDFLNSMRSFASYKSLNEVKKHYLKAYDNKAIDLWNKLALGSNVLAAYNDTKEVDRISASFIKTINQPKYGSYNNKNTVVYAMSDDINDKTLIDELSSLNLAIPNLKKIVLIKLENIILNSTSDDQKKDLEIFNNLLQILQHSNENMQLVFFQSKDAFYKVKNDPSLTNFYSNMVSFAIPQIQTYEARAMLNKNVLKDIKTPFTKEAKDRVVYHASLTKGVFPDKAVDLIKKISNYYGDTKKKITSKDVDVFAQMGYELFNNNNDVSNLVFDTGKTLDALYGKETTKKDIEAIIKQIKTGKIGTRGIIISSKDNEAGSGRKYTAETIAGEAKIPFTAIDAGEFATSERDSDGAIIDTPKSQMNRIFTEAKNAARQNQYKTAIVYINNFEELAFYGSYLPGYKQAMSQLTKEMQNAVQEDVSIIVIGSADEEYANFIPKYIRGFNQSISVDSPAFNKRARKEVIAHKINEVGLPLAYKNLEEKEHLLNKLVKLTEYMTFVDIKSLIDKTIQIMYERNKQKASIGEFIEAYLQLATGRTSRPEMPEFNKQATTSHECGHATNLEVMNGILRRKGQPWHQSRNVNFITLDPRGNFLGAVFEGKADNTDYPFEAMFTELVCSYGGYSAEKLFFNMDGSSSIAQDLAQATSAAKGGIEYCGFGFNTGKVSNAARIQSASYFEKVYKDLDIILSNARTASDLITETYKKFNEFFTQKYSKLIGSDDCMVDGDDFRKILNNWEKSLSANKKEEINILEDIIMDIIDASKKGIKYGCVKKL